ncbi:MAG: hypothetical protein HDR20_13905 [Lachnospiraceae bacterium]|nr:hypothetical protein [Lachnospiraceae bacterium]
MNSNATLKIQEKIQRTKQNQETVNGKEQPEGSSKPGETIIIESLILAQDERWRRA